MKKSTDSNKRKKILITIICIIAIIIIFNILNNTIIFGKNKTINLVINNKNVTEYLKKGILIQDDEIYI